MTFCSRLRGQNNCIAQLAFDKLMVGGIEWPLVKPYRRARQPVSSRWGKYFSSIHRTKPISLQCRFRCRYRFGKSSHDGCLIPPVTDVVIRVSTVSRVPNSAVRKRGLNIARLPRTRSIPERRVGDSEERDSTVSHWRLCRSHRKSR